jgi:hypothetical protein
LRLTSAAVQSKGEEGEAMVLRRESVKTVRLGSGSACSEDRIEPAVELADRGDLGYLCFDNLSECEYLRDCDRQMKDVGQGYDPNLEKRFRPILPLCARSGTKIIGNMGGANAHAAQSLMIEVANEHGLKGLKVATVLGGNVLDLVREIDLP